MYADTENVMGDGFKKTFSIIGLISLFKTAALALGLVYSSTGFAERSAEEILAEANRRQVIELDQKIDSLKSEYEGLKVEKAPDAKRLSEIENRMRKLEEVVYRQKVSQKLPLSDRDEATQARVLLREANEASQRRARAAESKSETKAAETSESAKRTSAEAPRGNTVRPKVGDWVLDPDGKLGEVKFVSPDGSRVRLSGRFPGMDEYASRQIIPEIAPGPGSAIRKGAVVIDGANRIGIVQRVFADGRAEVVGGRRASDTVAARGTLHAEVTTRGPYSSGMTVQKGEDTKVIKRVFENGIIEFEPTAPGAKKSGSPFTHISQVDSRFVHESHLTGREIPAAAGFRVGDKVTTGDGLTYEIDRLYERSVTDGGTKALLKGEGAVSSKLLKVSRLIKVFGGPLAVWLFVPDIVDVALWAVTPTEAQAATLGSRYMSKEGLLEFLKLSEAEQERLLDADPEFDAWFDKVVYQPLASFREIKCDASSVQVNTLDPSSRQYASSLSLREDGTVSRITVRDPSTGWRAEFDVANDQLAEVDFVTYGGGFPLGNQKENRARSSIDSFAEIAKRTGTPKVTSKFVSGALLAARSMLIKHSALAARCPQLKASGEAISTASGVPSSESSGKAVR